MYVVEPVVVAVNDLCIFTVVMFERILGSTLLIVSINLLCLNTWSNSVRLVSLYVVIAAKIKDLILSAFFVVDLASYRTVVVKTSLVVSGSSIMGVILAMLKSFNCVSIDVLFALVSVAPATGLIEIYTLPYTGVLLSSPPHT